VAWVIRIVNKARLHRNLIAWFRRQGRDLPWRRTRDPYAVLVSEFMLQQTRVTAVLPYYARWMERFPDWKSLAEAGEEDVLRLWQGLGYYSRARNLHRLAREVVTNHGGILPNEEEKLRQLPGIGEYTAAAVLAFAHDRNAAVLDANVIRVLARWLDLTESVETTGGRKILREAALALAPDGGSPREWHSAVMELGALLCVAGRPDCLLCPVRPDCAARDPASLPRKTPRVATTRLQEDRLFILQNERLLLQQSSGPRWRGLWILPAWEEEPPLASPPLLELKYPITRYLVTMRVHANATLPAAWVPGENGLEFHPLSGWEDLPLAAPHRRAVAQSLSLVHSKKNATHCRRRTTR
jgi:A/G-specific adenine glycosylase